ncbi:MAG: hypothetical protein ACM3SY_05015 [Candidatus Omnitrophota bacterium]
MCSNWGLLIGGAHMGAPLQDYPNHGAKRRCSSVGADPRVCPSLLG